MKWRRGFARICTVLSGLVLFFTLLLLATGSSGVEWTVVFILMAIPWVCYWISVYIVNGFRAR